MTELENSVHDILLKGCFVGGEYVSDFESEMAVFLDVSHVVGCSNGTDALMLGLRACGIGPGDEVITTPFTFFATGEAIAAIGAIPVFVDVREEDYNINPACVEEAITGRTRAILPVHIFGAPADMDVLGEIASLHGLRVIEDAAQAIGSRYKGKMAGTIGDVGCFSFYPTKNLGGAGDGGMVVTDDDALDTDLRSLREHGAEGMKYCNGRIGYNSRLDAIQAAILAIKLRHLDDYNERRRQIAERYQKGLTKAIRCPVYSGSVEPCWHQFVVLTDQKRELCDYLTEKGVGCGNFYPIPLHKQKAFRYLGEKCLPVAEKLASQTVCLPIYPEMTEEEIEYVVHTVNAFFG